ncbi:MAG: inorganic diphosphatase [Clostridia bacterium]|nr:inorganic diphosphatase [Clostridia bacterium]
MSKRFLGKTVKVVMDRPLGTKHPKHGFVYETNYGYIPDTISGDGEELDAYVLGQHKPLNTFEGEVIAIIHRLDDDDDKLIVVEKGRKYSDEQIRVLTEFQEQWFKSEIIREKGKTFEAEKGKTL